jgi:hypothetical protein
MVAIGARKRAAFGDLEQGSTFEQPVSGIPRARSGPRRSTGSDVKPLTRCHLRKTFVAAATLLGTSSSIVLPTQNRCDSLMMMAHDSTPGPGALDPETIDAVRSALVQYVATPADGEPLRRALDDMASEAHEKSIMPEQLLVVLKDVWNSLPSVRAMSDPSEQVRLLQRVVTICIREYYAD